MSSSNPLSSMSVPVACGPVPCDTEEGREYLQDRLAFFGKVSFLLCTGQFVLQNALFAVSSGTYGIILVSDLYNILHLVACGVFLATWLTTAIPRHLGHGKLALVDTLALLSIGILLGVRCSEATGESSLDVDVLALLGLTNVVLARAVLVPSSAVQTGLTSILAALPVILGSYAASRNLTTTALHTAWASLPVAIATLGSQVIYGLRQEVREAKQFGQYTLEEKIGSGGMGEVYRASHAMLRRPTALKLLRSGDTSQSATARFQREVQLTSQLTHPNTIAIYDYGRTPEGTFYYAMEYLEGLNLEQLISVDGPQPAGRVIHILRQVCGSLAEAHDTGLIHRDVKPANIILCERGGHRDVVKVVDFGLVKNMDSDSDRVDATVSAANTITGTPLYLSPEAIRTPGDVDGRSDLYALGAVGYYLITGEHVFESKSFMEICGHHLHSEPVPPSRRVSRPIPSDLEGLILMCLAKSRTDRPKDARALAAALESCADAGGWCDQQIADWWRARAPVVRSAARNADPRLDSSEVTSTLERDSAAEPTRSVGAGAVPAGGDAARRA